MDDPTMPAVPEPESAPPPKNRNSDDSLSRTLLIIGLVLVAAAVGLYLYSPEFKLGEPASRTTADQGELPVIPLPVPAIRGTPAPEFELPDLNGKTVRMSDFKGKIVLVNFWATWCNPCLTEIPWFIEFKERYSPQGFDVVAMNIHDEDQTAVMPFVVKYNMKPLNVVIATDETEKQFGGFPGLPVTFLVDREGKFYSKHLGLVSKEDVEDEILMLLQTSKTDAPDTKAAEPSGS
jgi:thiol-disulfide isomerase/thioredoxin